ncbi:MAG: glycosyltransferase family 4 protein [Chloroflexaceae bacterium]|nr:glycosyltransferase family 4 protein [Chloroflexaceae bacterium]
METRNDRVAGTARPPRDNAHRLSALSQRRDFPRLSGRFFQMEDFHGISVIRTWIYAVPRQQGILQRMLGYGSFSASLLAGGLVAFRPDVVIYLSSPLPGAITAWLVSQWHRVPFLVSVQDIEPERSVELGLLKNKTLIRVFEWMERFVYRKADRICVISEGMRNRMIAKGVPPEKLRVTYNWADENAIRPLPKAASVRGELGIEDKFVVVYSGNMGYTMADLETVVDAAKVVQDDPDIHFLLVGEGVRREPIEQRAAGLTNVTFMDFQPLERLPLVLAAGDVCLVIISREGTHVSVPSKTYSVMAAGRALLAICEDVNDTARVVREAQCGSVVHPGDVAGLAQAIRSYREYPQQAAEQGRRARDYFEQHFTLQAGATRYAEVMQEVIEEAARR